MSHRTPVCEDFQRSHNASEAVDVSVCSPHRCTRKLECQRGSEKNAWLWSPNQECVKIQSFDPPNLSAKKPRQVGRRRRRGCE